MKYLPVIRRCAPAVFFLCVFSMPVTADPALDKLVADGKYKEAIDYADEKLPAAQREAGRLNRLDW